LQRLAHRGARHAILFGQLALVETVARLALAFEDFNFQTVNDSR
jgi:hypothetical protein